MNKEWDLTPLYEGIDTEKFQNDMKALAEKSGAFNAFAAKLPETDRSAVLHRALELQEEIMGLALPLFEYAGLRSSVNTADQEAVNAQAKLQKLMSDTSAAQAALQAYVGRTENLEELIAADPFLGDYAYLLRTMRDDAKYVLDEKVEEALAKMNLSGGSAWSNLQSYLTSTVTADYRGEKIPLSAVRNLAYDADPQVRKDAYDAEVACYDKIKDGVCFALNSIKQQVTTEAEMRKAGSPLEMTLRHSRMQKTTLDAMIPEYQHIAVSGIFAAAIPYKLGKRGRIGHGLVADVLLKALDTAVSDPVNLIGGIGDNRILPLLGAARFDDYVKMLVVKRRVQHLIQVIGRHAVLGLKVRTAKVNHNRYLIISAALDGGILAPCGVGNGGVEIRG